MLRRLLSTLKTAARIIPNLSSSGRCQITKIMQKKKTISEKQVLINIKKSKIIHAQPTKNEKKWEKIREKEESF